MARHGGTEACCPATVVKEVKGREFTGTLGKTIAGERVPPE